MKNRENDRRLSKLRYRRLKREVLKAYGTTCAKCGTGKNLGLDHVNGNGHEHRRQLLNGNKGHSGDHFFRALKKLAFPNEPPYELQMLCRGCHPRNGRPKGDDEVPF